MVSNISLSVMAWASALRSTFIEGIKNEEGQGILEYVVLVGFIAIAAFVAFQTSIADTFAIGDFADKIAGCLQFNKDVCK